MYLKKFYAKLFYIQTGKIYLICLAYKIMLELKINRVQIVLILKIGDLWKFEG